MESTRKWKKAGLSTILWAILVVLLFNAPGLAQLPPSTIGNEESYDLSEEYGVTIQVMSGGTLNLLPGGYAYIYVYTGGNINLYGSHEYTTDDFPVVILASANAKLFTDSIDTITLTGDATLDVDNMIIYAGDNWDGTLTWDYQGTTYSLDISSSSDIEVEIVGGPATPEELIAQLIDDVKALNLKEGIENSLDAKLQNARAALEAANAGQRQDAVNKMDAFISAVEAQSGKAIPSDDAVLLIASAEDIVDLLLTE